MITGWTTLRKGQAPTGPGAYVTPYGTSSAMRGRSVDAMGRWGFTDPTNYQRYAGLPATGAIDNRTLNDLAARGAASVSPLAGLRGPTGTSGPATSAAPVGAAPITAGGYYPPAPSTLDTAPKAVMPQGNTQQRWQSQTQQAGDDGTGLKPLTDQRRFFWATGNIDARAPQANPQSNRGAIAPVTFNNSAPGHSDWQPY